MTEKPPILAVRNLSKRYFRQNNRKENFGEELTGLLGRSKAKNTETFLALDDVSFEVYPGDILGIIGPNGAGKSTLLKLLAEITSPTSGEIEIEGKLTSIIDIGTGFHPDLSGRENIYLSASVLGLSRKETDARFDEIVNFSGIGEFLAMPVKHYSSGMYLRLAFAVAFHTDIDVLLLDEVIAVGDAKFRNKSFQKIKELADKGTTILVVSHSMEQVKQLANRCMYLEKGKIQAIGEVGEVVANYLNPVLAERQQNVGSLEQDERFRVDEVKVVPPEGKDVLTTKERFNIELHCTKAEGNTPFQITLTLSEIGGAKILMDSFAMIDGQENLIREQGRYKVSIGIEGGFLNYGTYSIGLVITEDYGRGSISQLPDIGTFELKVALEDEEKFFTRMIDCPVNKRLDWNIEQHTPHV